MGGVVWRRLCRASGMWGGRGCGVGGLGGGEIGRSEEELGGVGARAYAGRKRWARRGGRSVRDCAAVGCAWACCEDPMQGLLEEPGMGIGCEGRRGSGGERPRPGLQWGRQGFMRKLWLLEVWLMEEAEVLLPWRRYERPPGEARGAARRAATLAASAPLLDSASWSLTRVSRIFSLSSSCSFCMHGGVLSGWRCRHVQAAA